MKQVCLYIVSILLITTSCTHQDDPISAITENDSVPLSISSVSLPDVEVGTRGGDIWQANDEYIGLAVYVYPTNGYAEKVVYYQYDEYKKTWGALNGENIYLGNAGAKLLIVYPVTLRSVYSFELLPGTYELSAFKYRLGDNSGYKLETTFYNSDWDWRNGSSNYDEFASYDVQPGVNKTNPYISINLKQAYAGLKVRLVKEDQNVSYFKSLMVYNNKTGVPHDVRFNFLTQTYSRYYNAFGTGTSTLRIPSSDIINEYNNWAATFFVAPNIEKGVAEPMTGILYITITARYKDSKEETRIVELDLSNNAYKNLETFYPGKQYIITLTWK